MTGKRYPRSIVWLRRDLRLRDNVALAEAAAASGQIVVAFNVDPLLLRSERVGAPIVQTFFDALDGLRQELRALGSDLALLEGDFGANLAALAQRLGAQAVFFNRDFEPRAIARDARVAGELKTVGVDVRTFLDHVVFDATEVRTDGGDAYKVYTPYARRWRERYAAQPRPPVDSLSALRGKLLDAATIGATRAIPQLRDFGFDRLEGVERCSERTALAALDAFLAGPAERYARDRDYPAVDGTSRLSVQLRAGTIGIRTAVARAYVANAGKWLGELIWREFFQTILATFPRVEREPFIEIAAQIPWIDDDAAFAAWCEGRTGYPIVDAAMRQLNTTGWMHNRLRMIVASFLTKDLLIDWRRGERYFEQRLADADLAQNNGGWQWAASTGTDAAPYFRIFNPVLQSKKFDPDGAFIRRMLPELAKVPDESIHEPRDPIVDHAAARERALAAYASVLGRVKSRP